MTPNDLIGFPLIIPNRRLIQDELKKWFGNLYNDINIFAYHDLLYNAAMMAKNKMGVVLTLQLESIFDDLKFVPLAPKLEFGTVAVWKKNQIQSPTVEAFIDFTKKYILGISDNTI